MRAELRIWPQDASSPDSSIHQVHAENTQRLDPGAQGEKMIIDAPIRLHRPSSLDLPSMGLGHGTGGWGGGVREEICVHNFYGRVRPAESEKKYLKEDPEEVPKLKTHPPSGR